MPTAGEARLAATKRNRSPEEDSNNNFTQNAAKKTCDPKADSKIPKPTLDPIGKRAAQKPVKEAGPTEAQLKHQEIVKSAQAEQESLAAIAAQAKLVKEATELAQATDPTPGPSGLASTSTSFSEPQEADPSYAYPQGCDTLDLTFIYTLADDPHKALQVARNTAEVLQAKQAIDELEAVSICQLAQTHTPLLSPIANSTQARRNSLQAIDLAREDNKLPDIPDTPAPERVQKGKRPLIKPTLPTKTSGFTPSSARKTTRGSRGGRGGARGRGAKTASTRAAKPSSATFNPTTATISLESDEEVDDPSKPNLARVRALVTKKNKNAVPEGDVEPIGTLIKDGDDRAPEPEAVPELTIEDVMPIGQKNEVDCNPETVVNAKGDKSLIDFILVQDIHVTSASGKPKGMSLPTEEMFRPIVNIAITNMVTINMEWCNVVKRSFINREGLPIITINYGFPNGAAVFRDSISGQSTDDITYNTYPAMDMIKKYGITVFIHPGYKGIPNHLLGRGLKGGSSDMKGDFEVVDCRTLKQEGKEECRILSLDPSKEFLEYLA